MLRVYAEVLEVIVLLRATVIAFEKRDPDLARQLKRASSSVALNIAEANGSRGRNRGARFHTALGSMRETLACGEVWPGAGLRRHQARRRAPDRSHLRRALHARAVRCGAALAVHRRERRITLYRDSR
jgi:four helix bundle protein